MYKREGLFRSRIVLKQSNILVVSDKTEAIDIVKKSVVYHRNLLEEYLKKNERLKYSLDPLEIDEDAPIIVKLAAADAKNAKVGPMAAVPGALADLALREILKTEAEVCLVENGGEISAFSNRTIKVGIFAGSSSLSSRIGFVLSPKEFPLGMSTSSASVGYALTFGEADAAVVFAQTASVSDAAATAICNAVRGKDVKKSIKSGLDLAESIPEVKSSLIIRGEYIGATGKLPKLLSLKGNRNNMLKAGLYQLTETINFESGEVE